MGDKYLPQKITPEKFALKFLTFGMVVTIVIFGLALPIIVAFPGQVQNELSIAKWFANITVTLIPGFGILLVLIMPLGRVLGTAIIFLNSEKAYAAAGLLVVALLISLIVYSFWGQLAGLEEL